MFYIAWKIVQEELSHYHSALAEAELAKCLSFRLKHLCDWQGTVRQAILYPVLLIYGAIQKISKSV